MTKKTLEEYQIQEIARTVFLEGAASFVIVNNKIGKK